MRFGHVRVSAQSAERANRFVEGVGLVANSSKCDEVRAREAFVSWCENADYATDDREAPHAVAFIAGYLAGTSQVHGSHGDSPREASE